MKKSSRKKYALGTSVKEYIPNPSDLISENEQMLNQAFSQAMNSTAVQVATAAEQATRMFATKGAEALGGLNPNNSTEQMAMGGQVKNIPVEVEGGEFAQLPNGMDLNFKGASHENGGIDVDLPEGTTVYSKRLKVRGKSLAERKKAREDAKNKLSKLLTDNPSDVFLKNTSNRLKITDSKKEMADQMYQNAAKSLDTANNFREKLALGDNSVGQKTFKDEKFKFEEDYSLLPENFEPVGRKSQPTSMDFFNPYTTGDMIGMAGTMFSTISPYLNTLKNRAEDEPAKNYYEDYGKKTLEKMSEAQGFVDASKDQVLRDLESSRTSTISRGRGSARSINTMRAIDLATDQSYNKAQNQVYSDYANQTLGLIGSEADFLSKQDQIVAGGEQSKDALNRAMRDNFYSQKAKDLSTIGAGTQKIGADLNKVKYREDTQSMIQDLEATGKYSNEMLSTIKMLMETGVIK